MSSGLPGLRASDPATRLSIYLADHLAGSRTGIGLARRLADQNQGTPLGDDLRRIAAEIEEDIESLKELMRRVGANRDVLKEGVSWTVEKLGRLKLNGQVLGYSPLSRLIELETLTLGVTGKLSGWTCIKAALEGDPRLAGFDLDRLIARAENQRSIVDRHRIEAAVTAFAGA
jgi:hypothetical protein